MGSATSKGENIGRRIARAHNRVHPGWVVEPKTTGFLKNPIPMVKKMEYKWNNDVRKDASNTSNTTGTCELQNSDAHFKDKKCSIWYPNKFKWYFAQGSSNMRIPPKVENKTKRN